MSLSQTLLILSGVLYGISFLLHVIIFSSSKESGYRTAFVLTRVGFLLGAFYFGAESIEHNSVLPVFSFSQAMAFFAWALAFVYLVLMSKIQSESFGLILNPILFLMVLASFLSSFHIEPTDGQISQSLLRDPYFMLHIAAAFFAYANFALSFAAGLLFLIQNRELKRKHTGSFYHKLPSLEELEKLIFQPILWGAPLLLAAIVIGMFWSKSAYQHYWVADPKTLVTVVITLFYFLILYLRYRALVRGRQIAWLSMFAFCLMIVAFIGTRFIEGSHNYLR